MQLFSHTKKPTMNLKKIIPVLLLAMCTSLVLPAFAGNENPANPIEKTSNDSHAQQLMNRLIEIRDMDKSNLTAAEKKALKQEVKEMRREYRHDHDRGSRGIYLSVGAIIIIILLLILIL